MDDKALTFKKGVAERMARDIMTARRKILRQADPFETYELMRLADSIKDLGQMDHVESLAGKFERGNHYLGRNLEIDDPEEVQEVANEMAAGLRVIREHIAELVDQPVTVERLRKAELICVRYGVKLKLTERAEPVGKDALN